MSQVRALSEIKPESIDKPGRIKAGGPSSVGTTFFRPTVEEPYGPHAILVRYPKASNSGAHFHEVDQFQIIMDGKGTFGRHEVEPYHVHFSRAYTRYGPLKSDGWSFMVMRSRYDPGSQRDVKKLKQVTDRKPWQITTKVGFPAPGPGARLQDVPEIKDDQGLFTSTVTMAPNSQMMAPDPSTGDGQHVLVVKGSIVHEGKEKQAPVIIFTRPDEQAFAIRAGAQGLQAIIMNLPKVTPRASNVTPAVKAAGLKKWQCELCAFAYDEALGMPEEGIAPGTRWEDVPATWSCPDCAATKGDFRMVEV